MYTVYAALEYVVVATNILYHATFILDMGDARLSLVHSSQRAD